MTADPSGSLPVRCSVVLVGPRAVGKSTLGAALAVSLDWALVDSDLVLAEEVGEPAGAYLARVGEPKFRLREREVVIAALKGASDTVLALGGGSVLDPEVRRVLGTPRHFVVFLRASQQILAARLRQSAVERPSLTGKGTITEIDVIYRQRLPLYQQVADLELETGDANVDACCAQIVAKMRGRRS